MTNDDSRLFYHPHVCHPPPVARFVAYLPPAAGSAFLCDLNAVQEAVPDGTNQDARQQRLYQQWDEFYATLSFNPTLQDPSIPRIDILQIYDHRVQYAKYSKLRMD